MANTIFLPLSPSNCERLSLAKSIDISIKTFRFLWIWGGAGVGVSTGWSGVVEYLLGFRTDVGLVEDDRFMVRFFWEFVALEGALWSLSGEDGFDFFLAGELDGDISVSFSWVDGSCRRRGLLIPLRISLMLEESSCERSGCGGSVVSMGVGRFGCRSSIGTGVSVVGARGFGVGEGGVGESDGPGIIEETFPFFCVADHVFGAGVWERDEMGMVWEVEDLR